MASTSVESGAVYLIINADGKALDLTEDGKTVIGYVGHGDKNQQV
jgi:hypothetical protein